VFVDTTSTYWEMQVGAELAETAGEDEDDDALPEEAGARLFGHSKDHRDDLPQVVIAMAVTRDGIPVRCWTFPGSTGDQKIIRKVKDDLGGAQIRLGSEYGDPRGDHEYGVHGAPWPVCGR
jgi:hypothetical protein